MVIRCHLFAHREGVVTVQHWLSRLLRRPLPDPRLVVGDSHGYWYWTTGHRILDSKITKALDHEQLKRDAHSRLLARLTR